MGAEDRPARCRAARAPIPLRLGQGGPLGTVQGLVVRTARSVVALAGSLHALV